jgi:type IV pilus assembly protein PilO
MALTGQDLLNLVNKAPLPQKVAGAALLVAAVTAANWFLFIDPLREQIAQKAQTLQRLEDDLIHKQMIANNLAQYKHDKEVLERRLAQALTELPTEANMAELISSLSETGNKSGLTINSITPGVESRQQFYASIPIGMSVTGNFHEVAVFLDSLSKLARIVNVSNLRMSGPRMVAEKLVLDVGYTATTFRFVTPEGGK